VADLIRRRVNVELTFRLRRSTVGKIPPWINTENCVVAINRAPLLAGQRFLR
jgi:hypothetical protein